MKNINSTNQSDTVKQAMYNLREALQSAIAMGVIAAGSDFEHHQEYITQNYWNIVLNHLNESELAFNHAFSALNL